MPPLSVIDDPNVLRNPCALISLSTCRIWYSPYHANVDDPPIIGCSELADHPPRCS